MGIDAGHMPIDNVEYDHLRVSKMAVEYLYQKGHRQIGFIGGGVGSVPMTRSRRYRSYRETMQDLGLGVRPEWVLDCDWDDKKMHGAGGKSLPHRGAAHRLLRRQRPDGHGRQRALYQLGIRVPDQAAIIGMSSIEMSQYANPPLTTIDVPTVEMGIVAARTLAARVRGDKTLPERILLSSTLIERDSV